MTWSEVPLRSLYRRVEESGRPDLPLLSVYRDYGVVLREGRDDNYNKPSADLSKYKIVHRRDLVINKMKAWQGSLGVSDYDGIVSPAYFVGHPTGDADHRYMHHLLRSSPVIAEYGGRSKGIRPSQWDLSWDEFASIKVRLPTTDTQRRLANYLDTETARIDALISKKRHLIKLLDERRYNFVSAAMTMGLEKNRELVDTRNRLIPRIPKRWRLMRLRHVVEQIIDTPHKTAPVVDDGEYLVVRTSNVKMGRLVLDGARYTDRASWLEWNHRGEPRPGDVLLTREAPAGEACIVPPNVRLCIGQRMVLLRVGQAIVSGEWVVHSIYSEHAQRFIRDLSNATTVAHLNMGDIPDIPVAVPDLREQQQLLIRIQSEVRRHDKTVSRLNNQIDLLAERRQALIAAVVTGEMPMPEDAVTTALGGNDCRAHLGRVIE